MQIINLFSLSCLAIQYVSSQYNNYQQPSPGSNICVGPNNTSMVEHFFNLIFSEFHNHPPVCVCVQMCAEQPTYCYPNGCFKKSEIAYRKRNSISQPPTAQVSQLQEDKNRPMSFLVDGHHDFMDNLLNFKEVDIKAASKFEDAKTYKELHRDPFKDRYQSIFKYKKTPKVHLRYNFREQVKHKKTDLIKIEKIDVSKTRWPVNVNDNKQYYLDKSKEGSKYFHNLDNPHTHYQSKFYKREVTKRFKPKETDFDNVENTTEASSFSLENLIENLIESSFGPLINDTELDLNVNLGYSMVSNATTAEPITVPPYKRSVVKKNILDNNTIMVLNETTNVVSMNNTDENREENKYHEGDAKNVFNDMIASLSKHIERNNNSSIDMMEHVLGHQVNDDNSSTETCPDSTSEAPTTEELHTDIPEATTIVDTVEYSTIETTTESTIKPLLQQAMERKEKSIRELEKEQINIMRKSHRRLMRKLHINNKPN